MLPPNTRVYAVGDIHGRADLLAEVIDRIDEHRALRPIDAAVEIYIGDYIDRGPDSRGVIDLLAVRMVRQGAICLRGNHEELLEAFISDPGALEAWLKLGGIHTLASYGIGLAKNTDSAADIHRRFLAALPRTHELFLQCLHNSFACGDFLFVHAGLRPGVPIAQQSSADLLWIRNEFLDSTVDHGAYIVHGHTPVPHLDIRSNRINIDTGAWRSGVLTCIALEGDTIEAI